MKQLLLLLLSSFFLGLQTASAQEWVEKMYEPGAKLQDIQSAFELEWANRNYEKGKGYKQFKRWEWFMEQRVGATGELPPPMGSFNALKQRRAMQNGGFTKAANWTSLGPATVNPQSYNPGNGRINVIAEDPNNPSIIYVGTPGGGMWKTLNGGSSWFPIFDDMITLGISGIVIDPSNSNVVYAATGDGDGGDTYSIGVVKSMDGGSSWSMTGLNWNTTATRRTHRLIMHPTDNQTLYCAASNGLFKTTDGAASWTKVQDGNIRDVKLQPTDPTTVYAATDVFLRSIDSGLNFDTVTTGLPAATDVNRMSIGVSANDSSVVYVLCGAQSDAGFFGLYRSEDSGLTFALRSDSPNIFGYSSTGSDSGGQSWYDMALTVEPTNADVVYAGGINVWKSTDGGTSWTIKSHWTYPSTVGYTHADIHFLDIVNNRLYCGSDGGIYRSTNGADSWTDLNAGLEIMQFYRLGSSESDPDIIIAGAQDNGSNLLDGGSWTHVYGADGMEGIIDPTNPNIIFCSSQNGGIRRSWDGGVNFSGVTSSIPEDGAWVTPYMFDPTDPAIVYAGFENVWRSDDLGSTWVNISNLNSTATIRSLAVSASNDQYIYFGTRTSYIRRTTDGGATWNIIDGALPNIPRTYISVDPNDEEILYVSFGGFTAGEKVYMSNDAGDTWTNVSMNLPNAPVNCVVPQSGTNGGLYVATDVGVFYYDNTLSGWQPYSQGLPNVVVNELEINYATSKLRAATYGRGIWESPLYTPSTAAPAVAFNWGRTNICAGDSIQFFDASLDAAPAWTWSFPGGSPATSNLQNPKVAYTSPGVYPVSLYMSNANGNTSFTDNVTITIEPHVIEVTITVDNYPEEISWVIVDANNNEVAAGGTYDGLPSGTTVVDSVCVADGCYDFIINDSYGDGICCGQGAGSYAVYTDQLGLFASGGVFQFSEATPFCVIGSTSITAEPLSEFQLNTMGIPGIFELNEAEGNSEPTDITVHDSSGRVLWTNSSPSGFSRQVIDLSAFSKGAYYVVVSNSNYRQLFRAMR
jgi:PKD repeat protein